MSIPNTWLSCYIYADDPLDTLLIEKIEPFVQNMLKGKLASQFFFIRYSDQRGRHIRLRFKGEKELLENQVKPALKTNFFSVRFVKYVPELRRYGGRGGIAIAEQLFEASSSSVLTCMTENNKWSYEQALGSALQMHIGMASGFGIEKKEVTALFGHIASAYHQNDRNRIAILEKNFKVQKVQLVPRLLQLWGLCQQDKVPENTRFATFLREMKVMNHQLRKAQREKKLRLPYRETHKMNKLWFLYESYVHMTNNRLGLSWDDESFVAYIIQKSLEQE